MAKQQFIHNISNSAQHFPFPSVADVERISALADPILRNLQITQCYHELSAAMAARTGTNANWLTFATWASKQVGQTIRKEDLARTLQRGDLRSAASIFNHRRAHAVVSRFFNRFFISGVDVADDAHSRIGRQHTLQPT